MVGIGFSLIGVYVIMRIRSSWIKIRGNIKAYKSYQQIYQRLNNQYADATKEELLVRRKKAVADDESKESDNDESSDEGAEEYELCGICREEMREAKKLPCSHKFHLRCLMGWMRYKHTCPICRHSLNDGSNEQNGGDAPAVAAAAVQGNNNVQQNAGGNGQNDDFMPWWLRLFGNFIQIHNVDIIDARNVNVQRLQNRGRGGLGRRQRVVQQRMSTEEMINRISEVLGGTVSEQDIRVRLLRTHSVERTIEYFLNQPR